MPRKRIKGIICAGGTGSRLAPLTQTDNKHLLPVYKRRMVEYPVLSLVDAGVKDIVLITGGSKPGAFLEYLKNGSRWGIEHLYYTYQEGNDGIVAALKLARPFVDERESCVVILGDNYFEAGIDQFIKENQNKTGAACLLKSTLTPWYFGIAEVRDQKIISIEEKPSKPKSDLAILGCYIFDNQVWDILDKIQPSQRGEFEITDALRPYMENGRLHYGIYDGYWSDMGTFETWSTVSHRVAQGEVTN